MRLRTVRPILITGAHRSGTTWVGKMVACHPRVMYFSEPFNPEHHDNPVSQWWHRVTAVDEDLWRAYLRPFCELRFSWRDQRQDHAAGLWQRLRRSMGYARRRWRGYRPLIKDPIALLSADWLERQYNAQVVVLIRHPAAFASSIKRLGWLTPAGHLLRQPTVMRDWLAPYEADLRRLSAPSADIIDHAIVGWNVLHHVIRAFQRQHDWFFCRHEDLSARPLEEFARLCGWLGLDFTEAVSRGVSLHSDDENPPEAGGAVHQLKRNSQANIWNWQSRLASDEISRIRAGTRELADHFYGDADWWSPRNTMAA